ncbi:MAG: cadherin-like domain-containing protein [Pirellulales bacterium]
MLVHGDVTTTDTSVGGTATIELVGTGDQTIDAAGGTGELHHVEIDKVSGTLTISDHIEISGDFTHTSGVVDASGSTVEFQGYNATISSGDVEFANVIFRASGVTTIDGNMYVKGDLTVDRLDSLNDGTVHVWGDIDLQDSHFGGNGRIVKVDGDYTTPEDVPLTTGNVLDGVTGLSGTLSISDHTQPAGGTLTYNGDGTFTFAPNENYHGSEMFEYTVVDEHGASVTIAATVTVTSVNDAPDAVDDVYTTDEDTPLTTGNVLTNDTDLDGDTLTVDSFTQPAHGSVTYNGDGTFTYTPADNYHGDDSFTYTVSDGHGGIDTATIDLTVDAVNDTLVDAGVDQVVSEGALVELSASVHDDVVDVDWNDVAIESFGGAQDVSATVAIEDGGETLHITGNGWKSIDFDYDVTGNTILEFDFRSDQIGEIHGIGFDNDNVRGSGTTFKVFGTQDWGVQDYANYGDSAGEWVHYRIEVGDHFTGSFNRLVFANDHDAGSQNAESMFRNARL